MRSYLKKVNFVSSIYGYVLCLFVSCNTSYFENDIEAISWEGDVVVPLGYATLTIADLLTELEIEDMNESSDGTIVFRFTDTLTSSSDIIDVSIPRVQINSNIETPQKIISDLDNLGVDSFIIPEGSPLIQDITFEKDKNVTTFDFDGMEMRAADFSDGIVSIEITSTFDSNTNIHLSIASFTNKASGIAYSRIINLPGNTTETINIELKDYNADFTYDENGRNNTTNSIFTEIEATIFLRAGELITKTGTITYESEIVNGNTNVIYGDFKDKGFSLDTETFDFASPYGDIENSTIDFTYSTLKLDIKNGFGFPVGIDVSHIRSYNDSGTESILSYSGVQNSIDVKDSANKLVIEGLTELSESPQNQTRILDNSNSNFDELLSIRPSTFELTLAGNLNPEELNSDENFYAKVNEGLEVAMTVDIPLFVNFDNVILEQEIVPFSIKQDIQLLKNLRFDAYIKNTIPLSGSLNFEFLNNEAIIEVSDNSIDFDAAPTNLEGIAEGTIAKKYYLNFTEEDLKKLKDITHYKTSIILNSPEETDFVKLLNTNQLELFVSSVLSVSTSETTTR